MANKKTDDHIVRGIAELKSMQAELKRASTDPSLKLQFIRKRVALMKMKGQAEGTWKDFWDEGNQ